jgi:hypothetical protein
MASEIRVLEDQLYAADYHNRVLHDELERYKIQATEIQIHTATPALIPPTNEPGPDRRTDSKSRRARETRDSARDDDNGRDDSTERSGRAERKDDFPRETFDEDLGELELPMFDEGEPIDPESLAEPGISSPPATKGGKQNSGDSSPAELLPAPGGPEPPGKNDLRVPPILPGEVLPPPDSDADQIKPPGQIQLPDSVQAVEGIPDELRIHPTLSGGHRIDGHIEEMTIVLNVRDRVGKTIDLKKFDVSAGLSLVILDPLRDASEARLGRWDFTADQLKSLIRSDPISGIHVPIQWQDAEPTGDEMIVHARLRSEEDEMRCEARLKVEQQTAIAEWTPRGEPRR